MRTRIKELRKEKGLSQVRLSIELGVSQETISAYEAGKHYPSAENLIKLSELLDASIDYILGLTDFRYPTYLKEISYQEQKLILNYRRLSRKEVKLLDTYVETLLMD